mmetsp:Transcript_27531/g.79799  ORF Transcript_27531/g.79799 Transcript_27531/m.79799 type:complete len:209 (-) Transcript_27531:360-986(-)
MGGGAHLRPNVGRERGHHGVWRFYIDLVPHHRALAPRNSRLPVRTAAHRITDFVRERPLWNRRNPGHTPASGLILQFMLLPHREESGDARTSAIQRRRIGRELGRAVAGQDLHKVLHGEFPAAVEPSDILGPHLFGGHDGGCTSWLLHRIVLDLVVDQGSQARPRGRVVLGSHGPVCRVADPLGAVAAPHRPNHGRLGLVHYPLGRVL